MGLFGMMNWLYTWYKPRVDPDAEVLAREISDIFLTGIRSRNPVTTKTTSDCGSHNDGKKPLRRKR